MHTPLALLLAAVTVAAPPPKTGPRIDLVAAPPVRPLFVPFPLVRPPVWGGYWGGFASDFYPYGFAPQPPVVLLPPPAAVAPPDPARLADDAARATAQASATLTLELPAAADVWLGDDRQPASAAATRTLTSPATGIGQAYTFRVRAEWTEGNTKYRTEQTATVRAGERGKLTVYAGTPIK